MIDNNAPNEALEKIRIEFNKLCAKYGHVNYQIAVLQRDKAMLEEELSRMNLEAAQLSNKE